MNKYIKFLIILLLTILVSMISLFYDVPNGSKEIILELRLPRLLTGLLAGGSLAVSGAVIQSVLANPLAEPYTLGVSSGAALGAVLALVFKMPTFLVPVFAFAGGILTLLIIFMVVRKNFKNNVSLILSGVMIGFISSSIISLLIALSDPNGVVNVIGWLMGDISKTPLKDVLVVLPVNLILIIYILTKHRALDCLSLGDAMAETIGVNVDKLRRDMFIAVSILVSTTVSMCGIIGFVGLVTPHLMRKIFNVKTKNILPASIISGALFVITADVLSRNLAYPIELPIGIFTSIMGVPFFLYMMYMENKAS